MLLGYCSRTPISGQACIRYPGIGGWQWPSAITDQITDQNTPYCDELRYAVSNDIRMLAVTQRSGKELNYLPGAPFSPSFLNKSNDTSGLDHFSGPLLGPLGHVGLR